MLQKPEMSRLPLFVPSNGDPLHLQLHFLHEPEQLIVARLIKYQPAEQRATLLVPNSRWYTALFQHPGPASNAWHTFVEGGRVRRQPRQGRHVPSLRSNGTVVYREAQHSTHMQENP
jgi:hypothetical protein